MSDSIYRELVRKENRKTTFSVQQLYEQNHYKWFFFALLVMRMSEWLYLFGEIRVSSKVISRTLISFPKNWILSPNNCIFLPSFLRTVKLVLSHVTTFFSRIILHWAFKKNFQCVALYNKWITYFIFQYNKQRYYMFAKCIRISALHVSCLRREKYWPQTRRKQNVWEETEGRIN